MKWARLLLRYKVHWFLLVVAIVVLLYVKGAPDGLSPKELLEWARSLAQ